MTHNRLNDPIHQRTANVKPQELDLLHLTTALRTQMMDSLTDADLAFHFPNNPTLGQLCREIGNVEVFRGARIRGWHTQDLVVGLVAVEHAKHADRSHVDEAARKRRLAHQDEPVERGAAPVGLDFSNT